MGFAEVVFGLLFLLVIIALWQGVRTVPQGQVWTVETLRRLHAHAAARVEFGRTVRGTDRP